MSDLTYGLGPVNMTPDVQVAMGGEPDAHRGERFAEMLAGAKSRLCALAGASACEVMVGSGTLANDVVAGQLKALGGCGIIVSQGEFGERLRDHAHRWRLPFEAHFVREGQAIDLDTLSGTLESCGPYEWLWVCACETSTGVLNDIEALAAFCKKYKMLLVLDAISAIGSVPVDLSGVYLASASSGKGLASYPGLGVVLYNYEPEPAPWALPRYLDLGLWAKRRGVPFTGSSNLLYALWTTLQMTDWSARYERIDEIGDDFGTFLYLKGVKTVAEAEVQAPHVWTISTGDRPSVDVGRALAGRGFAVSFESPHQIARNQIQIGFSGGNLDDYDDIELLADAIASEIRA